MGTKASQRCKHPARPFPRMHAHQRQRTPSFMGAVFAGFLSGMSLYSPAAQCGAALRNATTSARSATNAGTCARALQRRGREAAWAGLGLLDEPLLHRASMSRFPAIRIRDRTPGGGGFTDTGGRETFLKGVRMDVEWIPRS